MVGRFCEPVFRLLPALDFSVKLSKHFMRTNAAKTSRRVTGQSNSVERPFSSVVVDGAERAASRAMLYAVGFKADDFKKPQIGVVSTWSQVTPCNIHIDQLAVHAALGINSA